MDLEAAVAKLNERLDALEKTAGDAKGELAKLIDSHPVIAEFRSFLAKWGKPGTNG